MKNHILIISLCLLSYLIQAQQDVGITQNENAKKELVKKSKFYFNAGTVFLLVFDKYGDDKSKYYFESGKSKLFGVYGEVNYLIDSETMIGIGIGHEKINQPNIDYRPIYINLYNPFSIYKETIIFRLNLGTHLGNLSNAGFFSRAAMGYRIKLFGNLLFDVEGIATYQFFNKRFEKENYQYNMIGVGVGLGIQL